MGGRCDEAARASGLFREVLDLGVFALPVEESIRRGAELLEKRVAGAAEMLRDLAR